jgi:hypothetical protein
MKTTSYEDRKIRFPDRAELELALTETLDAADHEGVLAAVAGGVAMQLYGSPRLTHDVDIIASRELRSFVEVGRLEFDGVDGGQALRASNGVEVDVIVREDDFRLLYDAALDSRKKVRGVPTVAPEELAAIKFACGRARDFDDLDFLIAKKVVDVARVGVVLKKFLGPYAAREWGFFVKESRFRTKHGRR